MNSTEEQVMFVVLLRFAEEKGKAAQLLERHNAWLRQGFDDGVFLVAGSLEPGQGGALLAGGCTRADLEARVAADPFVADAVVRAEILELAPKRTDPRLAFLAGPGDPCRAQAAS
jgi:uncharacterized protein YciI